MNTIISEQFMDYMVLTDCLQKTSNFKKLWEAENERGKVCKWLLQRTFLLRHTFLRTKSLYLYQLYWIFWKISVLYEPKRISAPRSIISNSQDLEITSPLMNELIKKLWYMCTQQNITQPFKKKEILETLLFATTWIKFEDIIAMWNVRQWKTNTVWSYSLMESETIHRKRDQTCSNQEWLLKGTSFQLQDT